MSEATFDFQTKELIAEKSNYCCTCCGYSDWAMLQYDHIIPRSKGGPHTVENGQILCYACNQKKGENDTRFDVRTRETDLNKIIDNRTKEWDALGWKLEEQLRPIVKRKRKIHYT